MALIPLNTFKTKTAVLTTLKYNQAKCSRDTGLIIDSIAFDLLFGGYSQTAFAGVQYWSQGDTEIPGEVFQTLSALEHAKEVSKKLVKNQIVIKSVGNNVSQNINLAAGSDEAVAVIDAEYELIMDIIANGTAGTTNKIVSNYGTVTDTEFQPTTDTGIIYAAAILEANKEFLQTEVVAYVNSRFNGGYVYDQVKCARDTGLIVDSLAFDLLFSGSTQSAYAGLQYWLQDSSTIPNETSQTTAALTHAKNVISAVVLNQTYTASGGNRVAQVINQSLVASQASQTKLSQLMTNVINIITSGTNSVLIDGSTTPTNVTNAIVPNGEISTDELILNAYTLLQANKKFLQSEVVAWINNQKALNSAPFSTSFTYDSDKCYRDVSYIIDCISFDLIYGGNRQSLQAGSYYYGFSSATSSISTGTIVNDGSFSVGTSYIIVSTGNTDFTVIGAANSNPGTLFVATNTGSLSGGTGGTGTAIKANEISESISAYNYMKSLIGNVIEGQQIAEIYQTNEPQVVFTYYGTELETAAAEYNIDLITNIIQNGPSVAPAPQPISLTASLNTNVQNAASILLANKEFIKAEVIAYLNTTTQFNTVKAGYFIPGTVYTIETMGTTTNQQWNIIAGTSGNQYAPGVTFTAATAGVGSGTAHVGFKYPNNDKFDNTNYCYRDIGFIVDCINFDLLYSDSTHTSNRQAIQAGVYYFKNSATTSVVASEKTDTINAYNYMGIVMSSVIKNLPLTQSYIKNSPNGSNYLKAPYQTDVVQNINLTAPSSQALTDIIIDIIGGTGNTGIIPTLTNIINTGPSAAPPRLPIDIASLKTSIDYINAYNILMANKDYITAEVIGYMDELTSPNTTKIYTAPPGVTAIVLMAQVSNVTDRSIDITFAHYRNLPVFADPATLNGYQAPNTVTEIVKNYSIPPNDAATLIQGKMIIESFDSIVAFASESQGLKVTLSILETANA